MIFSEDGGNSTVDDPKECWNFVRENQWREPGVFMERKNIPDLYGQFLPTREPAWSGEWGNLFGRFPAMELGALGGRTLTRAPASHSSCHQRLHHHVSAFKAITSELHSHETR